MVRVSRGTVDVILVSKPDGTPVAQLNASSVGPEYLAAAISAISGVVSSILEAMNIGDYRRVVVELSDSRYLYVFPYKGDIIALITRRNPNLGYVNLLIELFFRDDEYVEKF